MNRPPAFQFYSKDWLDFKVQRMSFAAQGVYIKLLCFMWSDSDDQCSVIANDKFISKALGCSQKVWEKLKKELMDGNCPLFFIENGRYISKRLRNEEEKQRNYRIKQSKKGIESARIRLNHGSTAVPTTVQPLYQPRFNSSSSSSSSSSSLKKDKDTTLSSKLDASPQNHHRKEAKEILLFLNEKTGKNFRPVDTNLKLIEARLKTGATVARCRAVIHVKCKEWLGDSKMAEYLRPATLFNATKFEQYVGKLPKEEKEDA